MKKTYIKLLLVLIVITASANIIKAQPTSSLLSGKVLDEKNVPVQGVNVQITYLPWNKTREALTNKKGYFCVANLPPGGPYTVKFSCNGYEVQTREVSTLDLGNVNDLSLHMRLENKEANSNVAIVGLAESNEGKANKNSEL
ncbi:MAG: carboxypeptidase-like regulatory domain-containing protein [Prolixibacteraceae bacterium]